jgi:hypothetical protein
MEPRYLTKPKLIAINNKAKKVGGNHIDQDFVEFLPERFKFPVCMAVPLDNSWLRCWVTLGTDDPLVRENIHTLLLDMPNEVFDNLPSLPELAEVEKRLKKSPVDQKNQREITTIVCENYII